MVLLKVAMDKAVSPWDLGWWGENAQAANGLKGPIQATKRLDSRLTIPSEDPSRKRSIRESAHRAENGDRAKPAALETPWSTGASTGMIVVAYLWVMAWQLQRIEQLAASTSSDSEQNAVAACLLARFLEQAPADFIEPLLASPFGRVYKLFLERCCTESQAGAQAESIKVELSQKLRANGFQDGGGSQLLLALMPFFPPGQLKVEDAAAKLSGDTLKIYQLRYGVPAASSEGPASQNPTGSPSFEDRIFLNKILGLSNLYYIDPEDQEILIELRSVRLQVVELLINAKPEDVASAFQKDFGDRYWAMAQCGIQKESLNSQESARRDELQRWLSETPNSLHQAGGLQRFAATLLFNQPGSVKLADPERNLPAWFVEGFKRFNSMVNSPV